jgi:ribosome-associated protein
MTMRVTRSLEIDEAELEVTATTSRGPGGQHANRSQTRAVLRWNVLSSPSLTEEQRALILERLASRISREGVLQISVDDHRSLTRNRDLARERLAALLVNALKQDRSRRATKPTRSSRRKRVDDKKRRGDLKKSRGRPSDD